MNRHLLRQLQTMRSYPSVTILANTTPGSGLTLDDRTTIRGLIAEASDRLGVQAGPDAASVLAAELSRILDDATTQPCSEAIALCASFDNVVAVRLGRAVDQRVVIDHTFATRDLVADLNRTAQFRVVTLSGNAARLFVGDRRRLIEETENGWPMVRAIDTNETLWSRAVADALRAVDADLPVVLAGTERSIQDTLATKDLEVIGTVAGNHDRTGPAELHDLTWPLVNGWLEQDQIVALDRLDRAISSRRFAGGIDEIWPLANEGRIDLIVVEDGYRLTARTDDHGHLEPIITDSDAERDDPRVSDDVVDEAIEAVLRQGGSAVVVAPGVLEHHSRIAAVLRY